MLLTGAEAAGVRVLTDRRVEQLFADDQKRIVVVGDCFEAGVAWTCGCDAVVLATNRVAAKPDLVRENIR